MTTLYKLTDQKSQTRNATQWGEDVEHTASGEGGLCGPGWLHAYTSPLLAVFLNPIHANIAEPILWLCDGDVGKTDHGLKVGCTRLRTLHQLPLPQVTPEQRVRFAILCALKVYQASEFVAWANKWLSGEDRSVASARSAAESAARSAAWSAAEIDLIKLAQQTMEG